VSDQEALMYNLRFIMQENQEKRLFLLRNLFDMSFGDPCRVAFSIITEAIRWDNHQIRESANYLSEEGLLTIEEDDGSGRRPRGPYLRLTHKGIVEVEQSITNPTRPTEHFPSTVIQNFNASVGAVQTGSHSTAHAVQSLGAEIPEAFKLTAGLREKIKSLFPELQEAAVQLIEGLEDEFRLTKPRNARVKAFLKELNQLTDKSFIKKPLAALAKQYDIQL
jgi:hypothetical protein